MTSSPKVLLLSPTALDYHHKPILQKKIYLPGLTMPMLAAVTPEEVDLHIKCETVDDIPFDENWDLVGITGMGSGLARAWEIGDIFRKKGTPVVIGGIAASLCDPELTFAHADTLVTGEAEEIWPTLLSDFMRGDLKTTYNMSKAPHIDSLPLPRYDLLDKNLKGLFLPVQATRGCPFPCDFCSIQEYYSRTYRKREISKVIRDVRAAKAAGSKYITFIDDNIGVDWKYFKELMLALIPEKIIWISQCSIHIAERPDMLELASKSGCRVLSFGIESVNQESVESVGKSFNHTKYYDKMLKRIRDYGITISSEMILGFDEDKKDVFERTYDFVMRNKIPLPRFYILTPVPGTGMYRDFVKQDRIFDYEFGNYNGGKSVFTPKRMSPEELQEGYWKLYDKLYSVKSIMKRMRGIPKLVDYKLKTFILGTNMHYRNHLKKRIVPGIV